MAQKLNNVNKSTRSVSTITDKRELMKEALRRAEEIRENLKGRKHSDTTALIAEDRQR
jgi:hypothetical protein